MATLIFEIGKPIDPNDETATDNNVQPNEDLIYPISDVLAVGEIGQLGNVDLTGNSPVLANNHFLVYNGTNWVHEQPSDAIISLGVTATATELNKLDGATVSTTEINYLDIVTLGTSQASKAITVDANGDLIIPDSDKFQFGEGLDMTLYHDGTDSYLTNQTGALKIATETSGIAVQIGHATSEVTIGDNLVVTGNLTVNGQTTTVNSTVTTIDDPIITLGGDTAPGSDDNKDRGIEFRYHNGSAAKVGFFGFDDSTSKFTFIPDATNNSEVFSGSAGNVAFGAGEFSGDLTVDTSVLKVDSSNNRVGIGTASPAKVLHVVDTTGDAEIARFEGDDGNIGINGGAKITFSRNAINYLTCTDVSGSLRFETGGAGNNRLTIDSSGDSIFSGHVTLDNAKTLRLSETDANGSHYIALKAPDSVTTDTVLTLPDGAGTNGQALTTNGSGTLSWSTISASLTSASITGQTAITSIADDDLVLVADASDSNNLKKITKANFVSGLGGGGSTTLAGLTDTAISGANAGHILVYDGSNSFDNVAVSGDATLSAAGALTIAANAVEGSMLNDNVVSGQTEMTGDVEDTDELLISDAGTVKRADFSVVRDAVFNDVSGDATIAAGGALTIANDSVEASMLHPNLISGHNALDSSSIADDDLILVSDTSGSGALKKITKANLVSGLGGSTTLAGLTDTAISGPSSGQILVYDGSNSFDNVSISGDATLSAAGALTIAANAVEGSMLNDNVVSGQTEMTGDVEDTDELLISDAGTVKRADFSVVRDAVFNDVSGDATIAAGGSLTIGAGSVEGSMLHNNIVSGLDDIGAALTITDEIIVSDAGTIKRTDLSRLSTLMAGAGLTDSSGTLVLNIDGLSALGGTGLHQTEDHFLFSDNGTEKKITFSNLEDAIFGNVSGDATVSAGGALTVGNSFVTGKSALNAKDDNANDLVLVYDHSATALKKMTISTLLSGTGSGSAISNVVEDTTPQLGGALDVNGNNIVSVSNGNISLLPNGTGKILLDGDGTTSNGGVSIENGLIDLKNGGSVSKIKFYCESSNAHAQTLQGAPHSESATNTLVLPSAGSNLVSDTATQTLTNKTLTSPTINAAALSGTLSGTPTFSGVGTHSAKDVFDAGLSVKNGSTSAGFIEFFEDSDNGTNKATLIGPASTADVTLTLPAVTGTLVGSGDSGTVTNSMLAGSITAAKLNNAIFADLETLGAPASDGQFIVATGSGAFAYESANTARTSLGLGTGDSPTFTSLTLSAQAAALAMNSQKITGLGTPTADGDAATKSYVDSVAAGLDIYDSVKSATTASFTMASTASTGTLVLANGEGGFDSGADTFTVDGVSLSQNDRVLIKDGVNSNSAGVHNKWNGIYTVGALSGATLTLTRATDMDTSSEFNSGAFFFVEQGTVNADGGFVLTNDSSVTVGTTAIVFTQFSGAGQVTAGNGLAKSGNSLSVNVDDSSIEINSDSLRVKAAGITNAMLADDAVGADELAANAVINASIVDGAIKADKLDIDGSTDIGADLVDADLIVVDDGAGGTNRKSALSRIKKYVYSAISGDATASDAGALTLAASSVEGSMLNNNVISGQTAMTGDVADADELLISDNGTVKRADFSVVRDAVFNDVSGDATVAAGGALSIASAAITGQTAETSIADDDLILISDTSASGALKKMTKANFVSGLGSGSFTSSDITGQTAITSSQSSDIIVLADASDSNNLKKITKNDFLASQAHTSHSSISIGDFTFDQSGGSSTQYLRLKMNADENANEPIFLVENQSSSTYGPIIALGVREDNSNAIGDNDVLGQIRFQETEDNGGITKWASIHGIAQDHTNEYGQLDLKVNSGGSEAVALRLGTASGGTFVDVQNHDGSDSGLKLNGTLVTSTAAEINKLDGATVTTTEINLLDGGTAVGSSITIADADGFIVNDNGTMKSIPASDLKTYIGAGAADDLTAGDAAVTLTTTSGNITIDAQANDSDIIFKGTDNTADITMLTLDGSDAGTAIFNHDIKIQNDGAILSLGTNGDVSLTHVHDAGLTLNSTRYLSFNDTGTKVWSSEDGQLDLASDGTMVDSVLVNAASGGIKLNAGLDGNAAAIHLDSASGVTIAGGDNNDSVYVENSPIELEQISAPSTTTNKLYNVGGTLTWNGSAVGGGGSATIPLVTVVTGNTTAAFASSGSNGDNERVYLVNNGSTAVTITLPALSGLSGKKFQIKMLGTANVTIDGDSSETIDGAATFVLSTQYEAVTCVANATGTVNGWYII